MNFEPHQMSYAALGASALALAGWMLWSLAKRSAKRSAAEGELDARSVAMVDVATKPLQDVITRLDALLDEERTEKRRAQDERNNVTLELLKVTGEMRRENDARVAAVEENNKKSTERLHHRIDACDQERAKQDLEMADLRRENISLVKRMERLEEGERRLLERTPVPGQGVTIMPMPMQPQP